MQHGHERVVEVAKKLLVKRPRRGGENHRGERARAEFAGGRWMDGGNELVGGDFAMIVDERGGYGARIVEFLSHPVFHAVIFVENDEGNVWEKTDVAASHLHIERLSKGNQRVASKLTRSLEARKTTCSELFASHPCRYPMDCTVDAKLLQQMVDL